MTGSCTWASDTVAIWSPNSVKSQPTMDDMGDSAKSDVHIAIFEMWIPRYLGG